MLYWSNASSTCSAACGATGCSCIKWLLYVLICFTRAPPGELFTCTHSAIRIFPDLRFRELSQLERTYGCIYMYRCAFCNICIPPRQAAIRHVVGTRVRQYPPREKAHPVAHNGKQTWQPDPGGTGHEIVHEVLVCSDCVSTDQALPPD